MGRITEFFKAFGYNYGYFERILTPAGYPTKISLLAHLAQGDLLMGAA